MKQRINLYLAEFQVRRDPLSVARMAQLLGLVILVMALTSGWQLWQRASLNNRLAELRETLRQETRRVDEMEAVLSRRSENADLRARLDAAEQRLTSSRRIREFLGRTRLGNVTGFSEYLRDLSRAAEEGLYLNEIILERGGEGVVLRGVTSNTALVPRFVSNIERGRSGLRDAHFSIITSRESTEAENYSFSLGTR